MFTFLFVYYVFFLTVHDKFIQTISYIQQIITRKNEVADEINFFPPEGHVCLRINSNDYLYFGSARRGQESTWSMWNKLCRVSYVVDGNGASIENLLGGQFPHLQ